MCGFLPKVGRTGSNTAIYIVEQSPKGPFNKGWLFNVGFALDRHEWCHYFVFHDVDHVPERYSNNYSYREFPTHMVTRTSQFKYKAVHGNSVGGALMMNRRAFTGINGYSNLFLGWGGEDDNIRMRIGSALERLSKEVGVYRALKHKRTMGLDRTNLYHDHPGADRLSGLNTTRFTVLSESKVMCTGILIRRITVEE
jgi:hypothetical protein